MSVAGGAGGKGVAWWGEGGGVVARVGGGGGGFQAGMVTKPVHSAVYLQADAGYSRE